MMEAFDNEPLIGKYDILQETQQEPLSPDREWKYILFFHYYLLIVFGDRICAKQKNLSSIYLLQKCGFWKQAECSLFSLTTSRAPNPPSKL